MSKAMVCRSYSTADGVEHPFLAESLDADGVLALLAYETSHGNRAPIVRALTERLAAVRSGVEPAGPLGDTLPPTFGS